jgi:hypothetical protein
MSSMHDPNAVAHEATGTEPHIAVRYRRAVLRLSGLSSTQRLICLAIADYADKDGTCWPSVVETLAANTGLTERCIRQNLPKIEGAGWLEITRRNGKTFIFKLAFPSAPDAPPAAEDEHPGTSCTSERRSDEEVKPALGPTAPKATSSLRSEVVRTSRTTTSGLEAPEAPRPPSKPLSSTTSKDSLDGRRELEERLRWLDSLELERESEPDSFLWWRPNLGARFGAGRDETWLAWLDSLERERGAARGEVDPRSSIARPPPRSSSAAAAAGRIAPTSRPVSVAASQPLFSVP